MIRCLLQSSASLPLCTGATVKHPTPSPPPRPRFFSPNWTPPPPLPLRRRHCTAPQAPDIRPPPLPPHLPSVPGAAVMCHTSAAVTCHTSAAVTCHTTAAVTCHTSPQIASLLPPNTPPPCLFRSCLPAVRCTLSSPQTPPLLLLMMLPPLVKQQLLRLMINLQQQQQQQSMTRQARACCRTCSLSPTSPSPCGCTVSRVRSKPFDCVITL